MGTACPAGHDSVGRDFCDVCGTRLSPASGLGYMVGKHHAPGRGGVSAAAACPGCGATVSGPYCESCGVRVRARAPFAPLAWPAEPASAAASAAPATASAPAGPGGPSSGPPESLFPPLPPRRPEAWPEPEPEAAPEPPPAPVMRLVAGPAPPTTPIPLLRVVTWTVLVACDPVHFERMKGAGGRYGPAVTFPAHTSERRIPLTGRQMRIGRRSATRESQPEIDLATQNGDPGISRLHAVLTAAPDGTWSITDPGSANGTLLNGREINVGQQVTLHEGDRINLGAWTVITVHRG